MAKNCEDLIIRQSKLSDRDIVKDLVNAVFKKHSGHLWARGKDRLNDENFQCHHDKNELFIAEKDGNIIGCVTASYEGEDALKVGMLAVREDFQKQGVGRQLMEHTTQLALRTNTCKRMLVKTVYLTHKPDPWNKTIIPRFYHKLGYNLIETVDLVEKWPTCKDMVADDVTLCTHEKRIQ